MSRDGPADAPACLQLRPGPRDPCRPVPSRGRRLVRPQLSRRRRAAQAEAWPAIQAGRHVLIAAPTGSGKTLAAFLAAIDALVRQGLEGPLEDETQVVYVSPLKALSNDIQRNLEAPLAGIREALRAQGLPDVDIRTWVRTGDTPPGERDRAPQAPAAHRRDHAGVALHPARLGVRPQNARDHAHRDRRRDPCAGAQQARLASGAVARAPGGALRRPAAAHRPLGHAEADRDGGALPGRHGSRGRAAARVHDRRHRPPPGARSRARGAVVAARSGDVGGGLGAGLRPARRADRGASHHADFRQHAAPGRARDAPARRRGSARS